MLNFNGTVDLNFYQHIFSFSFVKLSSSSLFSQCDSSVKMIFLAVFLMYTELALDFRILYIVLLEYSPVLMLQTLQNTFLGYSNLLRYGELLSKFFLKYELICNGLHMTGETEKCGVGVIVL